MTNSEFERLFESIQQTFNKNEVATTLANMDLFGKNSQEQIAELLNTYLFLNQQFVKSVLQDLFLDTH